MKIIRLIQIDELVKNTDDPYNLKLLLYFTIFVYFMQKQNIFY